MTRILILTHDEERHFYFVNKILEKYGDNTKVFLNGKHKNINFFEKIKKKFKSRYFLRNTILNIIFIFYGFKLQKEKDNVEEKFFKNQKKYFYKKNKKSILGKVNKNNKSINDFKCIEKIINFKADIILVMGTCLLSEKIIQSAPFAVNMHTGLSPYYRGGYTNLWPFLFDDLNFFGVTIHKLSKGIDSGEIIFSENIEYKEKYSFAEINSRSIIIGTDLIIKTIQLIIEEKIKFIPQWDRGKIFNLYNFNNFIAYKYFRKIKSGLNKNSHYPIVINNGEKC